jgi:hypothetical protein
MAQYKNSGGLFNREKKGDSHPDMGGEMTITQELLDSLPRDSDGDIRIALSVWKAQGPKGVYLRVVPSAPWDGSQTKTYKKETKNELPDPWS